MRSAPRSSGMNVNISFIKTNVDVLLNSIGREDVPTATAIAYGLDSVITIRTSLSLLPLLTVSGLDESVASPPTSTTLSVNEPIAAAIAYGLDESVVSPPTSTTLVSPPTSSTTLSVNKPTAAAIAYGFNKSTKIVGERVAEKVVQLSIPHSDESNPVKRIDALLARDSLI